jgi:hypothetical protein
VGVEGLSKNLYYLVYKARGRRPELSLKVLDLDSRDFIRVSGVRASRIFKAVSTILDAYAIRYSVSKTGNRVVLELPADIGYATLLFTLLTYNVRNPERYAIFLEKLLAGRIPLSKHLGVFIDIAVGLSELETTIRKGREATINSRAARIVSKTIRSLINTIVKV